MGKKPPKTPVSYTYVLSTYMFKYKTQHAATLCLVAKGVSIPTHMLILLPCAGKTFLLYVLAENSTPHGPFFPIILCEVKIKNIGPHKRLQCGMRNRK